jgi:hypothetical protein
VPNVEQFPSWRVLHGGAQFAGPGVRPFPLELGTMSLINLVIVLVIVGVLLWLVNNYLPMDGKIKTILNVVVVIGVVIWLLQALGVLGGIGIR